MNSKLHTSKIYIIWSFVCHFPSIKQMFVWSSRFPFFVWGEKMLCSFFWDWGQFPYQTLLFVGWWIHHRGRSSPLGGRQGHDKAHETHDLLPFPNLPIGRWLNDLTNTHSLNKHHGWFKKSQEATKHLQENVFCRFHPSFAIIELLFIALLVDQQSR